MKQLKVLIVDDEEMIRKLIAKVLSNDGMLTYQAEDGKHALEMINKYTFDLVLLDIGLPDMSGYDVAEAIRKKDLQLPTVFLSGKTDESDIIKALDAGADSYITKPFSPSMLSAQVKSKIKRRREISYIPVDRNFLVRGPYKLDLKTYQFYKKDLEIKLTSKELKLLKFFMENPNQVFTKEELYHNVWHDTDTDDNSITVYVKYLRNKIEDEPSKPKYLKTIWGIGYQFCL